MAIKIKFPENKVNVFIISYHSCIKLEDCECKSRQSIL